MKVSIFQMFMALFGVALFVGVMSEAAELNSDNINDGGLKMMDYEQDSTLNYQKLITSLRLVDALIQNDIRELELAQTELGGSGHESSNGLKIERGFLDQLLNRKSRYLNKRMKSVALGFGKK